MTDLAEREYWQASVDFAPGPTLAIAEFGELLGKLQGLLPGQSQWNMPAFGGQTMFEISAGGVTRVPPNYVTGVTTTGWAAQVSAARLLIRHQHGVVEVEPGVRRRTLKAEHFPAVDEFVRVVSEFVSALPSVFYESARRAGIAASYVVPLYDVLPSSWLASRRAQGTADARPGIDGKRYLAALHEMEFEMIEGRRHVWNYVQRAASWFDSDGVVAQDAGALFSCELKTAVPEPSTPQHEAPQLSTLPTLDQKAVAAFFQDSGATGLSRVIAKIKSAVGDDVVLQ